MLKPILKRTVNIGEVEIFTEVYNRADMEANKEFIKIGDTTYSVDENNVRTELVWYGVEEEWVPQHTEATVASVLVLASLPENSNVEEFVVRVLNNDPEFDKEKYLKEQG